MGLAKLSLGNRWFLFVPNPFWVITSNLTSSVKWKHQYEPTSQNRYSPVGLRWNISQIISQMACITLNGGWRNGFVSRISSSSLFGQHVLGKQRKYDVWHWNSFQIHLVSSRLPENVFPIDLPRFADFSDKITASDLDQLFRALALPPRFSFTSTSSLFAENEPINTRRPFHTTSHLLARIISWKRF